MTETKTQTTQQIRKKVIQTESAEQTFELGMQMANSAKPGEIYTLDGDLGAGKTVFSQGFARGLGITGVVSSPTFTIVQFYDEGRLPLWHFDVYRIGDPEEMDEIGYEDCFYGNGVCLVEWSELIRELIPDNAVRIRISRLDTQSETTRKIEIEQRESCQQS